jgi:hypothetical protein
MLRREIDLALVICRKKESEGAAQAIAEFNAVTKINTRE